METIKRIREISKKIVKFLSHPGFSGLAALLSLIIAIVGLSIIYADYPNYPLLEPRISPISSKTYIDSGWDLVHDVEYSVELPKILTPDTASITMLTDVKGGFYSIYDTRGYKFDFYIPPSDVKTVIVKNPNKTNPILLRVVYVEKYFESDWVPVNMRPTFPNSNDSFYLLVKNSDYEIKNAMRKYTLVRDANEIFNTTIYDAWKNQRIIIYENNMPIQSTIVERDGSALIEVMSMKPGEQKTYFVKRI
jgi:hypothetical protein